MDFQRGSLEKFKLQS